jgi:peptide/nickel transport system permease protein
MWPDERRSSVLRLIARRLLLSLPLIFVVSGMTFLLVNLIPGDAAHALLGSVRFGSLTSNEQYAQVKRSLGLDQPLWEQYWHWLGGALHGDLGTSWISQQSVTSQLNSRLGATLSLIIGAVFVSGVLGVLLGAISQRRGALGRILDAVSMAGFAVPSFWLGLVLLEALAVKVHLFPASGYVAFGSSPSAWLRSLVLPVITLSLPAMAIVAKQTRAGMADALNRTFTRTLRAAGVPEWSILYRHALKNAANPILAVLGLNFVRMLGATVIVESVFAIPGLGSLAVESTTQHDIPMIQGAVVYFTIVVVVVNLLIDLAYAVCDPRVRLT